MAEQTSASIEIDASPAEVMAVIADLDAYPAWVDSIASAEVLSRRDGRPERVRMRLDHALVKDTYVLAYDWQPQGVTWHLVEGTLLKAMDGAYVLQPTTAGTSVTYRLTVDLAMPMIGLFKRKAERTIVDGALKGLKRRVEG